MTQEVWRWRMSGVPKSSSIFMTHFSHITRAWILPFQLPRSRGFFPWKAFASHWRQGKSRSSGRVWMLFRNENSSEPAMIGITNTSAGLTFSQVILIRKILHRTASSENGCSLSRKKAGAKFFQPENFEGKSGKLGGGFKYFKISSLFGKMIQFD